MSWTQVKVALAALLLECPGLALAQQADDTAALDEPTECAATPEPWIDRAHCGLHALVWRSAMHVDRLFGADFDDDTYEHQARGSVTPALLWDEFDGFDQKFRFRAKLPVPRLDERFNAFIGRFNRDEFITERELESGAIQRQRARGAEEEDQTLLGIRFLEPKRDGSFEADAGLRIQSPLDPFVKAGYRHDITTLAGVLVTIRETAFWQNSEGVGLITALNLERFLEDAWVVRMAASGTISEKSEGVRGYSAVTAYRDLPGRRAFGAQVFTTGEFDAAVPLGEYGARVAWRQSVLRDWLVLEIRPSVTWPKEDPVQPRTASWGLGVGFEMYFGGEDFQARPATF
jgi:hypothetical protein